MLEHLNGWDGLGCILDLVDRIPCHPWGTVAVSWDTITDSWGNYLIPDHEINAPSGHC